MKKFIKTVCLVFVLCITPILASANTTGHAWSESVGWFDFSNVIITDTAVTGHAYNDNTGWLSFDEGTAVINTEGNLSGYAWSESVGWFDFSNVYIEDNQIKGHAYNDNTGWLSFSDGTSVTTTWQPVVPTRSGSSGGGGGSRPRVTPTTTTSCTTDSTNIECLKELLLKLQAQLVALLSNTTPTLPTTPVQPPAPSNTSFTRDLFVGTEGEDVKQLQILLNAKGYTINTAPNQGAPGYESTYFGNKTQEALIKYQQANQITPASGYFGPLTRAKITQ